jgi:hypothetical protein
VLEAAGKFAVIEGEAEGHPLVAIVNRDPVPLDLKKRIPWYLSIVSLFATPTAQGMPSTEESLALDAWEEGIHGLIAAACPDATYVGRLTWNGQRELMFYIAMAERVAQALEQAASPAASRPFSFKIELDKDWLEVGVYLEAI